MQNPTINLQLSASQWKMLFVMLFLLAMLVFPQAAMAAKDSLLPGDADLGIPGASQNDGWAKVILYALRFFLIILFLVALGAGMSDSIFGIFRTINDARTSGEWGPAIKQIASILIAVIICLAMFALADKYVLKPLSELAT